MQVHFGTGQMQPEWTQAVVCIGAFDGVHLGHRAVIEAAVHQARESESPCLVVTFDRHPAGVLAPSRCPKAICGLEDRLQAISALRASATVVLPFNAWLSRLSAQQFLDDILIKILRTGRLVVGHDFAMGNGREGNAAWLKPRLPTTVVEPYHIDGLRVSSTLIRNLVEEGDLPMAERLLGRPFAISGTVVGGQKLGRQLGYPTLNLARSIDQVVPKDGVYAAWCDTAEATYMAAVSIGDRPTVNGTARTFEAYLLDYPGESLYAASVRLRMHAFLRGQEKFGSLDELKTQMAQDVDRCRALLSGAQMKRSRIP
jgi:riboflavin kinase/FMN adenylyltransferase